MDFLFCKYRVKLLGEYTREPVSEAGIFALPYVDVERFAFFISYFYCFDID